MNTLYLKYLTIFLVSSIPSGVIFSKLLKTEDPRKKGSGNIGASNAYRVGGMPLAILVALADLSKGFLAVLWIPEFKTAALFMACTGQMRPIFKMSPRPTIAFMGGKGVATFIGGLLGISPIFGSLLASIWITTSYITKTPALGSLLLLILSLFSRNLDVWMFIIMMLILFRHKGNFLRMLYGKENKIK